MVEREAYIDLVFRNGLKDLETLPPSGLWEEIEPVINRNRRPMLFLRIAAGLTLLFSLGAMAYFISKQDISELTDYDISINQEILTLPLQIPLPSVIVKEIDSDKKTIAQNAGQEFRPEIKEYLDYKTSATIDIIGETEIDATSLTAGIGKTEDEEDFVPVLETGDFKIAPVKWFKLAPSNEEKVDKWMLGALAAPTYYLQYRPDKVNLTTVLQNSEDNLMTYSGGLSFSYTLNKRLSIQSGIYYSTMANRVMGVDSYSGFRRFANTKSSTNFELATTNGRIITTNRDIYLTDNGGDRLSTVYTIDVFDPVKAELSYISGTIQQSFQYLEVPVILRYKLLDKKIDINLLGGLSYNLLIGNSAYTIVEGKHVSIGKTEGINPLAFSSSVGLGLGYDLSKKITFNLEPTLRYYLNTTGNRTDGKNHPYLLGIYSGIFYKF